MKKEKKMSTAQIILLTFGGCFLLIMILLLMKQIVNIYEENIYKIKAENYLENLYKEDFILEKYHIGYAAKELFSIDATSVKCGKDKNIKEYCYLAHPVDELVYTYITVAHYKKENKEEIYEGSSDERITYLKMKEIYKQREEIIEYLKPFIDDSYKIHPEEKKSYSIIIETNELLEEKLKKDVNYYDQLLDLIYNVPLNKNYIEMTILFNDGKIYGKRDDSEMISYISFGSFYKCKIEEVLTFLGIVNELKEEVAIKEYGYKKGEYIIELDKPKNEKIKTEIKSLLEGMENKNNRLRTSMNIKIFFKDSEDFETLVYSNRECSFK